MGTQIYEGPGVFRGLDEGWLLWIAKPLHKGWSFISLQLHVYLQEEGDQTV